MKKNGATKVCIVGLGRFGAGLARTLAGHCEVLAIDRDIDRVNGISDDVQMARCLDARDAVALGVVVSPDFDMAVVSIAEELEASILCTLHLRRLGVTTIIAKAHNEDHAEILRAVGADSTVSPEQEQAERLARRLLNPNLLDYIPLSGEYRVMDVEAPGVFVGKTLVELDVRRRFSAFVIAVRRAVDGFVFLPGPDFRIEGDDVLVVIGKEESISRMGGF
jgi:trk system potassium uptake protein TrkA